ncbi:MAG: hypothetical protein KF896_14055 [Ignavibacteriae bacterium]|nr:hypothetical protein [Ignavibacteriota bacterium]
MNYKQYSAYGETLLDTLGFARQGYIGKEKDVEYGLGDHGVRKYDYETGKFNSIDPLWEKYYGWTPYHYTRNNPICRVDFNGMDDGQFGSWMQVGPIQQQILGEKNVKTYQDVVKYSDKPENKELVNTWAEIGIMGLTGIGTEAALATKVATKYLSKAGNLLKGLFGFGDDAAKSGSSFFDDAIYSPKVLKQMNKADDMQHAFPNSVDGFATKFGNVSTKVGGDGKSYQWLKMSGSYGGKTGIFEYTKNANGLINHRFFNVSKAP